MKYFNQNQMKIYAANGKIIRETRDGFQQK
jgi:hypothetical protein